MKKSIIAVFTILLTNLAVLSGYEYKSSGNFRNGHTAWLAGDGNSETYWQLAENETEGFLQINGEAEKKSRVTINGEIASGSRIELYTDGGNGKKAICGCVQYGPYDGYVEFNIPEDIRAGKELQIKVSGSNASETKIREVEIEVCEETDEWGKIKPYSYSINVEENINLRADRLWDGRVEGAWFEPNWYIPWDISGNADENRANEIFGKNTGYPSKNAEIIWDLDGKYEISAVKAFVINSWRSVRFEYEEDGNWKPITTLGPSGQENKSWQRQDVYGVTADRLRISFPGGWEQARFLSEVEIWGNRINGEEYQGSGSRQLEGTYDPENEKNWYIFETEIKDLDVTVTYRGKESRTSQVKLNDKTATEKNRYSINGNSVVVYGIDREELRTGKQFLSIKSSCVESVILSDKRDDGKVAEEADADIERVVVSDGNGRTVIIEGKGKKLSSIKLDRYAGWEKEYYGSLCKDEDVSVELYRPLSQDEQWSGSIIGMTGDSQSAVDASGYGLSRADRVFWTPVTNMDFYSLKGKLRITAQNNGRKTVHEYLVKGGRKQKGGYLDRMEALEYTESAKWTISGKVYDTASKVIVNGKEITKKSDGTFNADVKLADGYQKITVEAVKNGETTGYWTKEVYRYNDEGIVITLNGDENGVITRESEYTVRGSVSNTEGAKLTVNGRKVSVADGKFEYTVQLKEGENKLVIKAEDGIGRTSEKVLVIIKDTTAPKVKVEYPAEGSYISSSKIKITVKADEKNYWYTLNGEAAEYCAEAVYEKEVELGDDFYSCILTAEDSAGNKSEEIKFNFCIDTVGPEDFEIIPDRISTVENWRNDGCVTVEFDTEDTTSGIQKYEYTWGNEGWTVCVSPLHFENLTDGIHTLFIRAADKAGNTTLSALNVYTDVTVPENLEIEADIEREKWTSVNAFGLYASAEDRTSGISRYTVSVDGGEERAWNRGDVITVEEDGVHQVVVKAYDKAGNSIQETVEYYTDITKPEAFEGVFNVDGWTSNCEPEVRFETEDNCSGIERYTVSIDDGEWKTVSSPYTYPPLKNGIHTTKIRAYDKAGNYTETEIYELKIDMEPPKAVKNCRLIPGNGTVEGVWETEDEDIYAYRILWDENNVKQEVSSSQPNYRKEGLKNGTVVKITVQAEDRAHNLGPAVETAYVLTGAAIVPVNNEEATLVEYENISIVVPALGKDSKVRGVMVKEIDSPTLQEKSVNPILSPIYSFTTLVDENDNGELKETNHASFTDEVLVMMSYDDSIVPAGFPENDLEVYYYDEIWGRWFRTEKSGIDVEQNIIVFLTNHFTNFSIQPTMLEDLSPEELKKSGHAYGNTESVIGDIVVSPEGGTMMTEATEFVIHGKNGFAFPVKRMYDSQTARIDGPSLHAQLSLGINFHAGAGADILKQLAGSGVQLGQSLLTSLFSKYYQRNGDYNLAMGAGWRLSLPYIMADNNNVMVRLPNGGYYSTNQMDMSKLNVDVPAIYHDMVLENHNGEDFTLSVKMRKVILNNVLTTLSNKDLTGSVGAGIQVFNSFASMASSGFSATSILGGAESLADWVIEESILTTKDGMQYKFGLLGYLTEISDASGTNVIKFEYDGLKMTKIIDPNGNEILFEYNPDYFLRPYITKITTKSYEDDDRKWIYTHDDSIKSKLANGMFCVLPQLKTATDPENRKTTYETDYSENNVLISGGGSAKLNVFLTILDFIPGAGALKDVFGVHSLTLTARFGIEWPMFIKSITAPQKGIQTVSYEVYDLSNFEVKPADYFLGCIPTAVKFSYDFYQKLMATSVTFKNGNLSRTTSYSYTFNGYGSQHLVTQAVVNDGRFVTINNYSVQSKKYYKYTCVDDNVVDLATKPLFMSEESNWEKAYYTKPVSTVMKNMNGTVYETTSYVWNSDYSRVVSETKTRGSLSSKTEYAYDNWGNITSETVTQTSKNSSTKKVTTSQYYNTSSSKPVGLPSGVKATEAQTVGGNRGLLIAQKAEEKIDEGNGYKTVSTVYTAFAYDKYGRNVWNGIYTDDGKWAATQTLYRQVTGNNALTDGLVAKTISPVGQETVYSYIQEGKKLVTYSTNVLSEDETITTKASVDTVTGLQRYEEDGNGNRTSYTYDRLGRVKKITHPGNTYETVTYDDKNHKITVYKDGSSNPSEVYNYDSVNNLISQVKYNYIGTNSSSEAKLTYDAYNNVTSMIDQNGNKTSYEYDNSGRMVKQTNPDFTYITYTYDDNNALKTTRDENGNIIEEYVNYAGLTEIKNTYVNGKKITDKTVYDASGRPVRITDGIGQVTDVSYSVFGKEKARYSPTVEDDVSGTFRPYVLTSYDERGLVKTIKTGAGTKVLEETNTYDGIGRKTETTQKEGTETRTVKYTYDKAGNVLTETDGEGFTKKYTYTVRNMKQTDTDANGNESVYEYDRDDNLSKMTDATGDSVTYTYDGYKRLVKAVVPEVPGNTQKGTYEIVYDKKGNALSLKDAGGKLTTWQYDKRNRKTSETVSGENAVSIKTSWTYDNVGNVLKETKGSAVTETSYDSLSRPVKVRLPSGATEEYTYDNLSRVVEKNTGIESQYFVYNALNKVTQSTDEKGYVINHSYDVFGNEIKTVYVNDSSVKGSGNQEWIRTYNAWGQVTREENSIHQVWTYTYDKRGLLSQRTDPAGTVINVVYDGNGNVTEESRTRGSKTETKTYEYDSVGFMNKAFDNGVTSLINYNGNKYQGNAWGLVTSYKTVISGKTMETAYGYDAAMNNTTVRYPDTKTVSWTYNGLGQITGIGDSSDSTIYASGGTYNECNNPVSINASNGTKREYSWNVSTNLLSGYNWGIDSKNNVSLEWDTRGNIVSKIGAHRTTYNYDVLNRLVSESTNISIEQKGSRIFTPGSTGDDVTGDKKLDYAVRNTRFDYFASSVGYNLNGQKKINSLELTGKSSRLDGKYIEIYVSDTGNDEDWTMVNPENIGFQKTVSALKVLFKKYIETSYIKIHSTWDERDEDYLPVDKSEVNGNVADIVEVFYLAEGKDSSWTYDAKGNRITSSERLGNNHSSKTVEYYAKSDLIKKYGDWYFSYDKNGNLTSRGTSAAWNDTNGTYDYSSSDGELWQYEYDLSNRMTRVMFSENGKNGLKNKASYTYDYRGLLVRKVTEEYVEYREYTLDGKLLFSEKGDEITDYIYKSNTIFAEIRKEGSSEAVYYHHTDNLGTTEAITDNNGNVVWEAEYEAFGSVLNQNGTKVFTASFTGKMYDAEAGMYYFNARWYDSEIGRFITEDPARDGIDWYAYCNNNPLRYTDPDGLEILSVVTDKQEQSTGNLGNSETTTIASAGCTLDTFYRMAKTLGYQGTLDDANVYALSNDIFLTDRDGEKTLLSQNAGAELVNGLLNNPFIKVSYDSSISVNKNDSSAATKLAKSLNAKESEKTKYFATLRQHTGNKYFTKEYDHSMSINHNAVFANDVSNIDNPLGFNYNDTASTNRTGTNDTTRLNQPFRIDYFKVEYLNWAQIENGY